MEEEAFHHYGEKVSLKSLKNGKYLAADLDNACATATGNHPILYVADLDFPKQESLKVLKFDNREATGLLHFGTALCFQTEDGSYLTFNASGELRVEKNPNYESGNNNIAKLAQWTIVDANNISNRGPVTQFDDISLRIPFGSYLMTEDNLLMSANGQAINEETTFKLVKANIPFLPDWLMKRPCINHNNLVSRPFFDRHVPATKRKTYEEEPKPIGSFPIEIQETLLIEDLLHAMNSIEGVYIRRLNVENEYDASTRYVYRVEPYLEQSSCDFSLLYLIGKILPMCNSHDRVLEFVSTHSHFEYGQISQAL